MIVAQTILITPIIAALARQTIEDLWAEYRDELRSSGADIDELKVKTIYVEQGATLKRFTARAKGRGNVILKQTCHIHVTVGDGK